MNKIKFLSVCLLASVFLLASCGNSEPKMGDFKLLPEPQSLEITGVSNLTHNDLKSYYANSDHKLPVLGAAFGVLEKATSVENAQIIYAIDESLTMNAEGYTLVISEDQISINAKDEAGLFYGFQTIQQLLVDAEEQGVNLPLTSIKDYPLLSYRAIHLDIKHHLEKTEYYYNLIDKLASYKINAILAETEDKIKFKRQPLVASADAISIEEWKKLSDYAKARHIEISPLVQGLGHASFVLKHEKYKHLRDNPKSDWAFNPLDPETYKVQFDLYLDAMEATPNGKYLHIGGDEVHTTGRDSGKSSLELQLLWLDKVCKFAEEHGRIPVFWDDMPLKDAGVYRSMFNTKMTQEEVDKVWEENEHKLTKFLDKFPKNCIYMRWNYEASEALGNEKAMAWFREHGMQTMGATAGQTRWVLMPQSESNMNNIKTFAASSINNDLKGLLLTLWDDDSPHFELYNRGIISFSEYTWTGEKRSKEDLKSAYRQREFSNAVSGSEFSFIDDLENPVATWKNALLKGNKRNYLRRTENAIEEMVMEMPDKNEKGAWSVQNEKRLNSAKAMLKMSDSIAKKIDNMKALANRNSYTLEVYEQVTNLVNFSSKMLVELEVYDRAKSEEAASESLKEIEQFGAAFKEMRAEFEQVYGKTRILNKPENYILDQDHHVHLANQSINFDWQFLAEMLFLEKLENNFLKEEVQVEKIKL